VMNSPVVSRSRMVRSLPRRSVREGKVKFPRGATVRILIAPTLARRKPRSFKTRF